jgi:hypothetical protein
MRRWERKRRKKVVKGRREGGRKERKERRPRRFGSLSVFRSFVSSHECRSSNRWSVPRTQRDPEPCRAVVFPLAVDGKDEQQKALN